MKTILLLFLTLSGVPYLHAQLTNSGSMMIHNGASVAVLGDFTNNGTFTDSGQVFLLNGNAVQAISGTSPTTFCNIKLANSAGARLNRNISVTKTLNLESGALELNAKTLTILNSQPAAISRTSGYIISELTDNSSMVAWQINSTSGNHVIPLATVSGALIPFEISVSSGNIGTFSLATYPTAVNNTPFPVTPVAVTHLNDSNNNDNSLNTVDRFWYLNSTGTGATASITFTATPAEIGTISGLVAQRWNDATQGWEAPLPGQISTAASVTVPHVADFSVWVLTNSASPLPVELLTFTALQTDNAVLVNWSTASETQSDYFIVEKTADFVHFSEIAQVDAAGTSNELLQYAVTDADPFSGISYYRLRQIDFDGNIHYSQFAAVDFGENPQFAAVAYPVPALAGDINLSISNISGESLRIEIIDFSGRCEYFHEMTITGPYMEIRLPGTENLGTGEKLLKITTSAGQYLNKRILIGGG